MSKTIKLKNKTYLDIDNVIHNRIPLRKPTLLWKNNSNNIFKAQSIIVDTSNFSNIEIIYKINSSDNIYTNFSTRVKDKELRCTCVYYSISAEKDVIVGRNVTIHKSSIDFGDCNSYGIRGDSYVNTSQNDMLIPIQIIGYIV